MAKVWAVFEDENTCPLYNITEEEYKTILAIRAGEAQVFLASKKPDYSEVNVGDIDQDDCEIIGKSWDGGFLVSSRRKPEEIEKALTNGAKRVNI